MISSMGPEGLVVGLVEADSAMEGLEVADSTEEVEDLTEDSGAEGSEKESFTHHGGHLCDRLSLVVLALYHYRRPV